MPLNHRDKDSALRKTLIALVVTTIITLPGVMYWNMSKNFVSTYTYASADVGGEEYAVQESSCDDSSFAQTVTKCVEWTEYEPHSTRERLLKAVLSSAIALVFVTLIGASIRVDRRTRSSHSA